MSTAWTHDYPPGVPLAWELPAVSVSRLFEDAVRDFPDAPAIVIDGRTASWRDVESDVDRWARHLAAVGVTPGTRVSIATKHRATVMIASQAIWRCGAAVVVNQGGPVSDPVVITTHEEMRALPPLGSLVRLIGAASTQRWSTLRGRARQQLAGAGQNFRARLRTPWRSVASHRQPVVDLEQPLAAADAIRWPQQQSTATALVLPPRPGATGELACTHQRLVAATFAVRLWMPDLRAGHERVVCTLPVTDPVGWTGGLLLSTLTASASVGAADAPTLAVAEEAWFANLESRGDLASVRCAMSVCADGRSQPQVTSGDFARITHGGRVRRALAPAGALGPGLANPFYGRHDDVAFGFPMTNTAARVVDPRDRDVELGPGTPGVLAIRGPQMAVDGWVVTDVSAVMDDHGVLHPAPVRSAS